MGNESFDATVVAKNIFTAIAQTGQRFGINYLVNVLIGSNSKKIQRYFHHDIGSFGALKDYSFAQVKLWFLELLDQDYLYQTKGQYPMIYLLDKAKMVLSDEGEAVVLPDPDPELTRKTSFVKGETIEKTVMLFKEGKSVFEISKERDLSPTTVMNHLAQALRWEDLKFVADKQPQVNP